MTSSCALHSGIPKNINNNSTEVVLSKNNYKVMETVQGHSKAMYVFGIGGLSKNALTAQARLNMLSKAPLIGGSKAVINEVVEVKHSIFPFVRTYKVTVTGNVIEFIH